MAEKISVIRKSVPIELEMDESGTTVVQYYVKEMSGAQRDEYQKRLSQKVSFDAEGKVTEIKDAAGLYASLLVYTLYDSNGKLVPESVIQSWPDSAQQALFAIARHVNGMVDKDKETDEKKE